MVLNATFNNISNISWQSVENIEYTSTFHISVIIRYAQSNCLEKKDRLQHKTIVRLFKISRYDLSAPLLSNSNITVAE